MRGRFLGACSAAPAWIAASLLAFPVLAVGTSLIASRMTSALGIAQPEREHFAVVAVALLAFALMLTVPGLGVLLGVARSVRPAPIALALLVLATAIAYLVFQDSRSGHWFDTDHALPELFVPLAVALLALTELGRHAAGAEPMRRAWRYAAALAGLFLVGTAVLALSTMLADRGGMYSFDQPLTYAAVAVAGCCGVLATIGPFALRRRQGWPG